jgi:fructose-1,6-bisphosphatase/sedoheptulose 1,7-bisphosphatase-like protein
MRFHSIPYLKPGNKRRTKDELIVDVTTAELIINDRDNPTPLMAGMRLAPEEVVKAAMAILACDLESALLLRRALELRLDLHFSENEKEKEKLQAMLYALNMGISEHTIERRLNEKVD